MRAQTLDTDPRLEDRWSKASLRSLLSASDRNGIVIVGYPDDEGVRLNRGRPGAKNGPASILKYLGRYVFQPKLTPQIFILKDRLPKLSLPRRHEWALDTVKALLKSGYRVITLGGGHDYGYPDATAYFETFKGTILNIDAHLDLRPVISNRKNSGLNSGTGFFRFVEKFGGFSLIEWGIQSHCNAAAHLEYAKTKGVQVFSAQAEMPTISGLVGISVCLDAFEGIRGVSAPAISGLRISQGLTAIETLRQRSHWLGLYESAPAYDPLNEDSARLAALMAYKFMH